MKSRLFLILNTCGAWTAVVALFFAIRGANVSDCIGVAVVGLIVSIVGTAGTFITEPDWRGY